MPKFSFATNLTMECNFNNKYTYFKFINKYFDKNVYIRKDGVWLPWCVKSDFEEFKITEDSAFCNSEERKFDYIDKKTGNKEYFIKLKQKSIRDLVTKEFINESKEGKKRYKCSIIK